MLDLKGRLFGRLTVLERSNRKHPRGTIWTCLCTCGNKKSALAEYLTRGSVKSCGCWSSEQTTHGKTGSREYRAWISAKSRCFNPRNRNYPHYGGRGITMCDRWRFGENGLTGFHCFYIDMGDCPAGSSIERINNNGNYEPRNVRWATLMEQNNNQQKTVWITDPWDSERMSMSNFCRKHGVPYDYFRDRYKGAAKTYKGRIRVKKPWPIEKIIAKAKILYPHPNIV